MKFKSLSQYFQEIEKTSSRNEITKVLASLFEKVNEEEISQVVYLLQGRIAPGYVNIEFGVAEKMLIKGILSSLSVEKTTFMHHLGKSGDLGATLQYFKSLQHMAGERDLTVAYVFNKLKEVAYAVGGGSQVIKVGLIADLISALDPLSCRFLVRIPTNTLRLGFSDMTILDAYSWALAGDKSLRKTIEAAYHVLPDLGKIGHLLKTKNMAGIKAIEPELFTPIIMMRAERLANPEEIIKKLGACCVESKFDGFRLQAHIKGSQVKLYSRNLEEVSYMYPDVVAAIQKEVDAATAIIEGEAIGFNPRTHAFLPFQETVQRKRKYDIEAKAKEVPLKFITFEILYKNGKSYLNTPFQERRKILKETVHHGEQQDHHLVLCADDRVVSTGKEMELLFESAIARGLEGIMAKKLDGIYQAGARGFNWIKFKKSYSVLVNDTVDCVVMGYDFGKGKRATFGLGAFLVGVLDEKTHTYKTVSKIGTGLTDIEWKSLKKSLNRELESKTIPALYEVDRTMTCDVWVKPAVVIEIRADEITRSTMHTAHFALRFPRVERFRDDKKPEDATTIAEIEEIFNIQYKHIKLTT